jgi:hypothetical protein
VRTHCGNPRGDTLEVQHRGPISVIHLGGHPSGETLRGTLLGRPTLGSHHGETPWGDPPGGSPCGHLHFGTLLGLHPF